jgi:hypothetical protein
MTSRRPRTRLAALPRHDAELGGLDLYSRLDEGNASGSLADKSRVEAVIDRFRAGVVTSLDNPARVYGWHTQAMFAEVVRGLRRAVLLTESDQGATWGRLSDNLRPGDFRIVLEDGRNLSVEVKNHVGLTAPFRMRAAELEGFTTHAKLTGSEPRLAIYWTRAGLWLLVRPEHFTARGDKVELSMAVAMAESEMADLGDDLIGAVPPFEFTFEFEELPPFSEFDANGTRLATAVVKDISISAGGQRLRSRGDQRLAFYLFWNGRWPETHHDDFESGRLRRVRFRYEPERWEPKQGFAFVGFRSQLIARSYWLRTSEDGAITKLRADLDPESEGMSFPDDLAASKLGLRVMEVRPRGAASAPDTELSKARGQQVGTSGRQPPRRARRQG